MKHLARRHELQMTVRRHQNLKLNPCAQQTLGETYQGFNKPAGTKYARKNPVCPRAAKPIAKTVEKSQGTD